MRRIIAVILVISLVFILASCTEKPVYKQTGELPEITQGPSETATESEFVEEEATELVEEEIPVEENQIPNVSIRPTSPSNSSGRPDPTSPSSPPVTSQETEKTTEGETEEITTEEVITEPKEDETETTTSNFGEFFG